MKKKCKVSFDYIPENDDELELQAGEVIDFIREVNTFTFICSFSDVCQCRFTNYVFYNPADKEHCINFCF